ncbi:DUF5685 family protein [Clostridium sediminicola]|uniref:DUF5685 family protein n=1 Tax=Clostridium sediminicola TaxID=3114879 RepID=UPI0031F25A8B
MFGYVTPCKMELKIKDYEKFKAYYCGLCISIKNQFGEIPRLALNYDMTFLAILLDSLSNEKNKYIKNRCIAHPVKQRVKVIDSTAIDYAAFCNVALFYYKLLDDFNDDKSLKAKMKSSFLYKYLKNLNCSRSEQLAFIEKRLKELDSLEKKSASKLLDELSHPFADLTAYIISNYIEDIELKFDLYWLGYNLGKWIYIIDAFDDLEEDMKEGKFNAIEASMNHSKLPFEQFKDNIENRIDLLLCDCARNCYENLNKLQIEKNKLLLENILLFGLPEKMDIVFKRRVDSNDKSI